MIEYFGRRRVSDGSNECFMNAVELIYATTPKLSSRTESPSFTKRTVENYSRINLVINRPYSGRSSEIRDTAAPFAVKHLNRCTDDDSITPLLVRLLIHLKMLIVDSNAVGD